MRLYVDIVGNEWAARRQIRVARLALEGESVTLECDDDRLREVILRPYEHPGTSEWLHPEKSAPEFVRHLHTAMTGSHLWATEPYEDPAESAFAAGDQLEFESIPV